MTWVDEIFLLIGIFWIAGAITYWKWRLFMKYFWTEEERHDFSESMKRTYGVILKFLGVKFRQ